MEFEWDIEKAASNLRRHGVSFHDAATAMEDPLSTTFPDKSHSEGEARFITIGETRQGQLVVVTHAERGEVIRIINARSATKRERVFYEQS